MSLSWIDRGAEALRQQDVIGVELAKALKAEARRRANLGKFFGNVSYAAITAAKF